jgi:hypothetical protein
MKTILRRLRPSPAMVVACTALLFAMTGAGYAAVVLGPNTVGTKQLKRNAVTSIKVKNGSLLRADFRRGQIPAGPRGPQGLPGQQGIQGVQGAQGIQGPAGPGARWARVHANGSIIIQSGGITSTRTAAGVYRLDFGEDVSRRLIVASEAGGGDDLSFRGSPILGSCVPPAGSNSLIPCVGVPNPQNHVAVFTFDESNAVFEDHGFYLTVIGPDAPASAGPAHEGGTTGPLSAK